MPVPGSLLCAFKAEYDHVAVGKAPSDGAFAAFILGLGALLSLAPLAAAAWWMIVKWRCARLGAELETLC